MNIDNINFLLSKARSIIGTSNDSSAIRVLDYGCGNGISIEAGTKQGLDMFGVELFSHGSGTTIRAQLEAKGLLGDRVKEIRNGTTDFPNNYFDVVISNQVFEHVPDIREPLKEIARVLKPNGTFINCFPCWETLREAHSFIPFAHWFTKGSKAQYWWLYCFKLLGAGRAKQEKDPHKWAQYWCDWIPDNTSYLRLNKIHSLYAERFNYSHLEDEFLEYRLRVAGMPRLARFCGLPVIRSISPIFTRSYASLVIIAKPL